MTSFGAVDIAVLTLYFLAVVATGLYAMCASKRDTTAGYFLAGRFVTFIPIGASLFASNIGSEHFIGLAGSGAAAGLAVGAFELNAIFMLQLLGWIFLPVYIVSGVYTLPEYIKRRFGGRRIQVFLSVLSLVIYILTKVSVNLYSGSLFINTALHWNFLPSILLILGITAFCTISGGLAAVIYTDTLQAFLMIAGGITLMVFAFIEVGGINELYRKYLEVTPSDMPANGTCGRPRPDSLVMLRDPVESDMPWPGFLFGQSTASIWYWCADQVIVQRALAAKNLSHGQGGTFVAGYMKFLPLFVMVLPGMISRVLFADEIACATPEVCEEVCQNPAGCSNLAYPKLIINLMPVGLKGLMVAVMLAALVTDLTSIFNSASSLFTMDIYPLFRRRASTRELMIVGRLFVVVMSVISIFWIPVIENFQGGQMFLYIQAISAYLAPPIAAIFLVAILWSRANEKGTFWALMAGFVTGGIRMVLDFVYPEPRCDETDGRPLAVSKMHFMYFALILFVQTVVVMVVVSLVTRALESWRTIRTVYWKRFDSTVRPDDFPEPIQRYHASNKIAPIESEKPTKRERPRSIPGLNLEGETNNDQLKMADEDSPDPPTDVIATISTGKADSNEVEEPEAQDSSSCWDRFGAPSRVDAQGLPKKCGRLAVDWLKFAASWFCGLSLDGSEEGLARSQTCVELETLPGKEERDRYVRKQELIAEHEVKLKVEAIQQNRRTRTILTANLFIIIGLDIFAFIFFTIPPELTGLVKKTAN